MLFAATSNGVTTTVTGLFNSFSGTDYTVDFYASAECDPTGFGEGESYLGAITVTNNIMGNAAFGVVLPVAVPDGSFVTATATDPGGSTSEFSACQAVQPNNTTWPNAFAIPLQGASMTLEGSAGHIIDRLGQSRWYKFTVQPDSKAIVTLDNLPANYDITLYKDIKTAYNSLLAPKDLAHLSAEHAPDVFTNPDAFTNPRRIYESGCVHESRRVHESGRVHQPRCIDESGRVYES